MTRSTAMLLLAFALVGGVGCVRGPRLIATSHAAYNEMLRQRLDEELLLNLVRLRYRDRPLFLGVNSVITRFVRSVDVGLVGQAGVDGATAEQPGIAGGDPTPRSLPVDAYGRLNVGYGFSEQPTVTFTPLQGEDFAERLMRPVELETLALLQRSGWSIERVLRLTVQRMNDLDNASGASGPTPAKTPSYRRFVEAARALRALQTQRAVVIGTESGTRTIGVVLPTERLTPADLLAAARDGHRFVANEDGTGVVLRSSSSRFVVRVGAAQDNTPEMAQFREVLGLRPDVRSYGLTSAAGSVEDILGTSGERDRIVLVTRSLLGMLFYLSQAIDMPASHEAAGLVTVTRGENGEAFDWSDVTEGLLHIRSSEEEPEGAAIAVPYRGWWFYISDNDLTSKSTFALLAQLYALQSGDPISGGAPVPTIPIAG